eukprot:jgi/Tetstr1/439651/TSEL_028072.t1
MIRIEVGGPGSGRALLLAVLLTAAARADGSTAEENYAEVRKGEFLAAQYKRAVSLEAEALQLAAAQRYAEANESLALSVRIHEQLLGPRHPQLLKPLLVAAENAAVWGSDLGMGGKPQVLHAMELLRRGLQILYTAPHPTQEQMEEEAARSQELMEVLEQMLAAISPPQTLASSRAAGSQPSLPAGIRAVQAGELVADALHPWNKRWAFFATPVAESWIHAQAQEQEQAQVMVYGIQTTTTVTLMTHESMVSLHALLRPDSAGGEESKERCQWAEPGCAETLDVQDFSHFGGEGVAVGQCESRMWFHFVELPAEEGPVALLGARLGTAAPGTFTFMLQVHAEPLIPLHIEEGVQNWELDGFRASIHYFTGAKGSELHSLKVTDLKCAIPSMVRVLVAWGAVPDTGKESVARSRRCVASRPPGQSALLPGGCWREGAGEPGTGGQDSTLYVVVINPCPDPTTYTVEAKWGRNGAGRPPNPAGRAAPEEPGGPAQRPCDEEGHCSLVEAPHPGPAGEEGAGLRKRFAREAMQGSFTPAASAAARGSAMDKPLPWPVQVLLSGGLVALVVGALHWAAQGRLGKVRHFGPPSQRRRPRPGAQPASLFRLPTWAELSGAPPRRDGTPESTYELQLRRGRVTVSEVRRAPADGAPGSADGAEPPASASSPGPRAEGTPPSLTRGSLRSRQSPVRAGAAAETRDRPPPDAAPDSDEGSPLPAVSHQLPDMYHCPITQEVMRDPVFASDGYTYERAAIAKWLRKRRTSPMTNLPISAELVPNLALRSAVREALDSANRRPA